MPDYIWGMKSSFASLALFAIFFFSFSPKLQSNVEFICFKKHVATNTCHFNFKVDGAEYRFVDNGCEFEKNKQEILDKAKAGSLGLAKDWKLECQQVKEKESDPASEGF